MVVTCAGGVAPMLAQELAGLGLEPEIESPSAVRVHGDAAAMMNICLQCRTAHRVLWLIREQSAPTPETLYDRTHHFPWEEWISSERPLTITASGQFKCAKDTRFAALKVKDAVVDRLREKTGQRPDTGSDRNGSVIHIHGNGKDVAWYLDAAGQPLAYRGYRLAAGPAPMRESLAAACLIRCGWQGEVPLINPMCGSGTIAIEAALIACGVAPGLLRESFAFRHWIQTDSEQWETFRAQAKASRQTSQTCRILASDRDPRAVERAQQNAERAGVRDRIEWSVSDYRKASMPEGDGLILMNPEYGVRMGQDAGLDRHYQEIGWFWRDHAQGKTAALFCGNPERAIRLGLAPARQTLLYNGNLECRLFEYRL